MWFKNVHGHMKPLHINTMQMSSDQKQQVRIVEEKLGAVKKKHLREELIVSVSILYIRYWQPGQPNSFNRNQDCGEIVQKEGGGEWNDDGCFAEQLGICEK